jgi:hypothetical protein
LTQLFEAQRLAAEYARVRREQRGALSASDSGGPMTDRAVRWGGVAAIVFVVLVLITVFAGGPPPAADDPADKIRTYLVDHRTGLLVSNFLGLLAIPFVIWFGVVLRELVRGDRTANALGTASLAGLLVTAGDGRRGVVGGPDLRGWCRRQAR